MAAIRSGKLAIPDYVDKPLAAILQRALTPDLRLRYRTAGEKGRVGAPKGVR